MSCQVSSDIEDIPAAITSTSLPTPAATKVLADTPIAYMPTAVSTATVTPTIAAESTTTVTTVPSPSSWQIDSHGNSLLYVVRQGQSEIYLLRPEDKSYFISLGNLVYGQPWSPDSSKFIFDTNSSPRANPESQLALADLDTGKVLLLELLQKPSEIFWSPVGNYLLYIVRQNDMAQVVLYDVEKKENKVLTEFPDIFSLAGWSFDGQKIAFVSDMNGQYDLYTLDVNTLDTQQLTNTLDIETAVTWSPTASQLLFGTTPYNENILLEGWPYRVNVLYLLDSSGSNLTLLGHYNFVLSESVAWSFNGQKIAYSDAGKLCILDIETKLAVCPLEDIQPFGNYYAAFGEPPAWSPDDNWLAFRASGHRENQCAIVYILELNINEVTPADIESCAAGPIYWLRALP